MPYAGYAPDVSTERIPTSIAPPSINPEAIQIQEVAGDYERGTRGINTENVQKALSSVPEVIGEIQKLDAAKQKSVNYKIFQSVLDAGMPAFVDGWKEAGSPPDLDPKVVQATLDQIQDPAKKQEFLATAWQHLTGVQSSKGAAGVFAAGGGIREALPKLAPSLTPEKMGDLGKDIVKQEAVAKASADKTAMLEKVARIHAAASVTRARMADAIKKSKDAGLAAAVEKENKTLTSIETKLEDARVALEATDAVLDEDKFKAKAREVADLEKLRAASNARVSSFLAKMEDPSKATPKDTATAATHWFNPVTKKIEPISTKK